MVSALNQFEHETDLFNWQQVFLHWLGGEPLGSLGGDRVTVTQFIESDVIYRLVWGMEAALPGTP